MRLEERVITGTLPDGTRQDFTIKVPVREKDRCIIVGCASSKDIVPWDFKDAEYWGVNNLFNVPLKGSHYDRWFEIHSIWVDPRTGKLVRRGNEDFRGQPVSEYMKMLGGLSPTPIYMQKYWADLVPNSVPYPLGDLLKFFIEPNERKPWGMQIDMARYLTNTISIELALAIYEGFKFIEVWGVDMAVGTEYQNQRPSCEFWAGIAQGMGINVYIPPEADLLKTRFIYGFEEPLQRSYDKKVDKIISDMKMKQQQAINQLQGIKAAVEQYNGAIHFAGEMKKIWANLDDKVDTSS